LTQNDEITALRSILNNDDGGDYVEAGNQDDGDNDDEDKPLFLSRHGIHLIFISKAVHRDLGTCAKDNLF
jgi:hypothetical protein